MKLNTSLILTILLLVGVLIVVGMYAFGKFESYDFCQDLCAEAQQYGCNKPGDGVSKTALLDACHNAVGGTVSQSDVIEAMEFCGDKDGAKFAACVVDRL